MPRCVYCKESIAKAKSMSNHQSKSPRCIALHKKAHDETFNHLDITLNRPYADGAGQHISEPSGPDIDDFPSQPDFSYKNEEFIELEEDAIPPPPAKPIIPNTTNEQLWDEAFPSQKCAGATIGVSKTLFESYKDNLVLQGAEILSPFESDEEWELAKWLIRNVGHT